ncbi:MAG: hypothetical protein U0132_23900 [Gemmatimonadaceae bacterium]
MTRPFLLALACLIILACHSRDAATNNGHAVSADSSRFCGLTIPASLPRDSIAVRCAEAFVARNGYTDVPVQDTGAIAHEFIEPGATPREVLSYRRHSLGSRGVTLCHDRREQPGFTVGFAAPADTVMQVGRAVTMDSSFRGVKMEHQTYLPRAAAATVGCAWIARSAGVR